MQDNKFKNYHFNKIDFDSFDIEKNVDHDINEYMDSFNLNNTKLSTINVPKDIDVDVKDALKLIRKENTLLCKILDVLIVSIILLPIIGIVNPKIFKNIPVVYPVFEKVNNTIKIDNLKSILGLGKEKEVIEGSVNTSKNTVYIKEEDIKVPRSNNEAIKLVHSLANTLVEADYKWQCAEVTPKTIRKALDGVVYIEDSYAKMHIENALKKWKKGDFSNVVAVHNYVWEMLNGNVGKAENPDKKKIEEVKEKYY